MKIKFYFILAIFLVFISCKKESNDAYTSDAENEVQTLYNEDTTSSSETYSDGTYCAEIEYYNPETGTSSTYTLNVEVENNELSVIQWPNGGWLDSSHFSPEELDSNGSCSFSTFDGKQYEIQITGSECSFTDEYEVRNDIEDESKLKCPECGNKKYRSDDLCDDCQDKIEHTCKRCGEYDSFMWSSDEYCSDCKNELKDEENEE